jgi:hypothetical protein
MASLAGQLAPLINDWARQVVQEAAQQVFDGSQALCPVETGATKASGTLEQSGDLTARISYDDRGFTDEGPDAHEIEGNPLLAFDWPQAGLFPAIFRRVAWVPGAGVAENKGWFSERSVTDDTWQTALIQAAEDFTL